MAPDRQLRLIALLFYVSAGLTHVFPFAMDRVERPSTGQAAHWDIRDATVAIFMLAMLFTHCLQHCGCWSPGTRRTTVDSNRRHDP